MKFWNPYKTTRREQVAPVDFTLPDDEGRPFVYDAEYRRQTGSVLVFYRGHW